MKRTKKSKNLGKFSFALQNNLKEEEQLDKLIEPIKNLNLSPYEKYLAVYNIVKNFKPYKQSDNGDDKDRFLKDILNNEFIVCAGFTKLLECLLDKVNINSQELILDIDGSYDANTGDYSFGGVLIVGNVTYQFNKRL